MDPQCCHAKGYFWSLVYMYLLLRKGAGSIIILQKEKTIHIINFMWLLCYTLYRNARKRKNLKTRDLVFQTQTGCVKCLNKS